MARARLVRSTSLMLAALAVTACASVAAAGPGAAVSPAVAKDGGWVSDVLYFGMSIPGGGVVPDSAFNGFVRDVVTPRFPDGLTTWAAHGQWRGADGRIAREDSRVVQVVHRPSAAADSSVAAITAEYERRFHQESVLRVRSRVEVSF